MRRMKISGISAFVLCQLAIEVIYASTSIPVLEPTSIPSTWFVNQSSNVCVIAQFKAELIVDYVLRGNGTAKGSTTIPDNATVNESMSSCNETVQILQLDFKLGESGSSAPYSNLKFTFEKQGDYFSLSHLTFELRNMINVFSDSKHDVLFGGSSQLDVFKALMGCSYYCKQPYQIDFRGSAITFTDIKLEAFRNSSDLTFSDAGKCGEPKSSSMSYTGIAIVTIVAVFFLVAVALGFYYAWKHHFIWNSDFERLGP